MFVVVLVVIFVVLDTVMVLTLIAAVVAVKYVAVVMARVVIIEEVQAKSISITVGTICDSDCTAAGDRRQSTLWLCLAIKQPSHPQPGVRRPRARPWWATEQEQLHGSRTHAVAVMHNWR